MKIAYIPQNNPYDKNSWSGTDYYTRKSLENQGNIVYCIFSFRPQEPWYWKYIKFLYKIFHKDIVFKRTINASKQWASFISDNLEDDTDAIFSLGTLQVAYLKTKIPIFIYVDGIFEQLRKEYGWSRLSKRAIREANIIEQDAIDNCRCIISCAVKTKEAIEKDYKIEKSKLKMVPLGANWDEAPSHDEVVKNINNRSKTKCKLLFVGVEWERKGADIVIEAAGILNDRGFPVEVCMCGLRVIPYSLPSYVVNYGFLNKENEREALMLNKLFSESHFLFVPSRAEAYGLVFCEASAYGLPSISHRVGGLTTTIIDGVNGQLFEKGTHPLIFADYIMTTFNDKMKYKTLCLSSLKRYESDLNWNVSGKKLDSIIKAYI